MKSFYDAINIDKAPVRAENLRYSEKNLDMRGLWLHRIREIHPGRKRCSICLQRLRWSSSKKMVALSGSVV